MATVYDHLSVVDLEARLLDVMTPPSRGIFR